TFPDSIRASCLDRRRADRAEAGGVGQAGRACPAGRADGATTGDMNPTIGIIGGSGLYDMAGGTDPDEKQLQPRFGDPSGPYVIGTLRGKRVAFLARHGVGHRILPSELNFRANIYGFKVLGVERILSASAVGSLKHEYRPLDIVVPDQFFDRTK